MLWKFQKTKRKRKKKDKDDRDNNEFNYKDTYEICAIIIKYIPKNDHIKKNQIRLYNLYKLFDKNIGEPIEIDSMEIYILMSI